jgi:ankyrin repeat protein
VNLVKKLLDKGVKIDTPRRNNGWQPIHLAVQADQRPVVELLLARGASINATATNGLTPLHVAVQQNNPAMAEFLLSRGAKVDMKAKATGVTPLHIAAGLGKVEVAKVLLAHGASVSIETDEGLNALQLSERPVRNPERAQELAAVHALLEQHTTKPAAEQ